MRPRGRSSVSCPPARAAISPSRSISASSFASSTKACASAITSRRPPLPDDAMNLEAQESNQRWLPNAAPFAKMKIVVIDDEPANVALLEAMLAEGGYTRIKTITDSRLAIEACVAFEPDLVLLDLMMPYVDGFSILESLRE